jgi:hypothetical protein
LTKSVNHCLDCSAQVKWVMLIDQHKVSYRLVALCSFLQDWIQHVGISWWGSWCASYREATKLEIAFNNESDSIVCDFTMHNMTPCKVGPYSL